jgi:hypothetical protein
MYFCQAKGSSDGRSNALNENWRYLFNRGKKRTVLSMILRQSLNQSLTYPRVQSKISRENLDRRPAINGASWAVARETACPE